MPILSPASLQWRSAPAGSVLHEGEHVCRLQVQRFVRTQLYKFGSSLDRIAAQRRQNVATAEGHGRKSRQHMGRVERVNEFTRSSLAHTRSTSNHGLQPWL